MRTRLLLLWNNFAGIAGAVIVVPHVWKPGVWASGVWAHNVWKGM